MEAGRVKEITALSNPLIKDLRALALKKNREREQLFIVEGLKPVLEGLDLGHKIRILVYDSKNSDNALTEKAAGRAYSSGALVIKANAKIMSAVTHRDNAQNLIGVFEQKWASAEQILQGAVTRADNLLSAAPLQRKHIAVSAKNRQEKTESHNACQRQPRLFLALDRIRDRGNLGTIIRTADAAGAAGIFLIGETTSPFALETVRATMGSLFALPFCRLSEEQFLQKMQQFGGMIIGTHLQGAVDYRSIPYFAESQDIMLIMGNEQKGLTENLTQACSALARIPQTGRADSLNLAVSTGIMLYEIMRSRLKL